MKYHVYRKSKHTGQVEVRRTKCSDFWCSEKFMELHPEMVWEFSKQGAQKIVDRENAKGWHFEYWMEPVKTA